MKTIFYRSLLLVGFALVFVGCSSGTAKPGKVPALENRTDTLSWAYGQNIADALQTGFFAELDADLVLQSALYTLHGGTDQPLSREDVAQALQYIMAMYGAGQMQQADKMRTEVDKRQEEYFQQLIADNPAVKRHPAGFCYEVLRAGKGRNAQYADRIRFDYRSFLMFTGEPYDQTYGKRDPIIHVVGEPMFRGLIEAFQLMNAGSIYRFYFPYQLAFGENGAGEIPGFTPFIYEVELHEIYKN